MGGKIKPCPVTTHRRRILESHQTARKLGVPIEEIIGDDMKLYADAKVEKEAAEELELDEVEQYFVDRVMKIARGE